MTACFQQACAAFSLTTAHVHPPMVFEVMYQKNCKPLPAGDASVVFAAQLAEMNSDGAGAPVASVTPQTVVRWADTRNQPHLAAICRRLLLPGSGIKDSANLGELTGRARDGTSCLLCFNHRSNLDVPTLYTLLQDHGDPSWFPRIIWIAGRKLEEDAGMTGRLVQCFNRVIVTPPSWFAAQHSDDELHQARLINIAAERAVARLRHQGWVFALFPTATRLRPGDQSTQKAIEQTDSYLRTFEYLVLCNIDGCTMPVSKDRDLTHETPMLDRVLFTFAPVHRTRDWRTAAASRFPELDQRMASARAMSEDLEALAPDD